MDLAKIVFVDEAGIDNNEVYVYGWSEVGTRLYALKPGNATQRLSIISALNQNQIIAPLVFEGYTNTEVFITYLQKVLVPSLQEGQTVIIDNAAFHKDSRIQKIIEDAGCHLKFLPPYSPDLNPIEHFWYSIKNKIRKKLEGSNFDLFQAVQSTF